MAEPFLGQIIMTGYNFAPRGYASCEGQLLAISENDALFALLGTTFGGDGQSTFGLPDLRGRVPIHQGTGSGLATRQMGERGGAEVTTIGVANLPQHSHNLSAVNAAGNAATPGGNRLAASSERGTRHFSSAASDVSLASDSLWAAGASTPSPISTMQPYLSIHFAISLEGIFPSRN
jgi:microcystin-dependent protein